MVRQEPNSLWSKVIALTGSIGAGKSTVLEMFRKRGAVVFSADVLAREVVEPGTPALKDIVQTLGPTCLSTDGQLDRAEVARQIFSNQSLRKKIEQIIHPRVAALAEKKIVATLKNDPNSIVLYEVPLLFEVGLDSRGFRATVSVLCEPSISETRLFKRSKLEPSAVQARRQAQLPDSEKASRSDFVILNNGSLDDLEARVSEIWSKLKIASS